MDKIFISQNEINGLIYMYATNKWCIKTQKGLVLKNALTMKKAVDVAILDYQKFINKGNKLEDIIDFEVVENVN